MEDFIGRGIYTYSEASRLLQMSPAQIRGLVNGYKYKDKSSQPVIAKKTINFEDKEYLSFLDIIEIRFIKHFLDLGVKRAKIVDAYVKAKKELKKENPFATKFTSDGKYIFADNNHVLLDLHTEQLEMRDICAPTLLKGIDFEKEIPVRWRPYEEELPDVVLDPEYRYGKPLIKEYNITTKSLYDAYIAEKNNVKIVSEWYNVPTELVMQAVSFEQRLSM